MQRFISLTLLLCICTLVSCGTSTPATIETPTTNVMTAALSETEEWTVLIYEEQDEKETVEFSAATIGPDATPESIFTPVETHLQELEPVTPETTKPNETALHEHKYTYTETAASCTRTGERKYTCACGKVYIESIPKLEHVYILAENTSPTTIHSGSRTYQCTRCSISYSETVPTLPGAMYTDMCGPSLLCKTLPHAENSEFAQMAIDTILTGYTSMKEAQQHTIPAPGENNWGEEFDKFKDSYRYLYRAASFAFIRETEGAQLLFWHEGNGFDEMHLTFAEAERIIKSLGIDSSVTQYEAISRINNYICNQKTYTVGSERNPTLYYSVFNEYGVCHNYTMEFQTLCLAAGIECHYYTSGTMNHAWNKVIFSDGTYRWVDVCWNDADSSTRTQYLLVTTEQLSASHTF